jgi:hypothetical protein
VVAELAGDRCHLLAAEQRVAEARLDQAVGEEARHRAGRQLDGRLAQPGLEPRADRRR